MRRLQRHEIPLLTHLTAAAGIQCDVDQLVVEPMQDGGMSGLLLNPPRMDGCFGAVVAVVEFNDVDGVRVPATLNLDEDGQLFELDIWKVDFSPLQRWPTAEALRELAT